MPQAVATWVLTTFFAVGATSAVAAMTAAYWAAYLGTTLVIAGALGAVSRALTPMPKMLRGMTQEWGGTVAPREIVYGTVRKSGMNAIPPVVSGSEGEYLHQVLVLAGHKVDDITDVYFNQTTIADANIGSVTGTANDGLVSSGTYANQAWIRRYDGTQTTVDYILNTAIGTEWTTTDKGQGLAYLGLQYKFKKSVYGQTGKPEVSALVKGKRVYDPRLDSTNGGSGAHRYTDSTTWAYSNNPALCLADYLMDDALGLGEDPTRIDWPTVAAAANECDEVVSIPGSTTQKRYTCNVVLTVTDRYEDNIEVLCTAMLGHCYYSSGQWQVYAGSWSTAAFALDETDLAGAVTVQADTPREQKYNAVRGMFYDSARSYQPSEFQPRTSASYESDDGERIWREVDFRACTNGYEAQRNAIIILRRSRNRRTVTADFGMSAFKVRPYETGTLTITELGWTNKPVRCIGWEFRQEGTVRLVLQEEASTDWSDPAVGDYTTLGTITPPSAGSYTPPSPTALTATSISGGVLLSWSSPELAPGSYFEIYRYTSSTPFASATLIATTYGNTYLDVGAAANTYYYWVRPVSGSGTAGTQYPTTTGVTGGLYAVYAIHTATDNGALTVGSIGDGSTSVSQLKYATFTPAVTCDIVVRFNCRAYFTGGVGGYTIRLFPYRALGDGSSVTTGQRKTIVGNASEEEVYSGEAVFSATGGTQYRGGLYATITSSTNPATLYVLDVDVTVEELRP